MEVINICLSEIPKELIRKAKGKSYINLVVNPLREVDNYGNDLTVYIQQSKEERERKEKVTYVGKGKTYSFENQRTHNSAVPVEAPISAPPLTEPIDDLPF